MSELELEHDRRRSSRYRPARSEVLIGWEGPEGFQSVAATLVNISYGGVAVRDEGQLPEGKAAWARLSGAGPTEWARVAVRGEATDPEGDRLLRLSFPNECPYDLFRVAVFGFATGKESAANEPNRDELDADDPAWAQAVAAKKLVVDDRAPGPLPTAVRNDLRAAFARPRRFGWAGWSKTVSGSLNRELAMVASADLEIGERDALP